MKTLMKTAEAYDPIFKQLCYSQDFSQWTRENMVMLTSAQLSWMCRLLGAPYTGTKDVQIVRLLDTLDLRRTLTTWGEDLSVEARQEIAARHKLKDLRELARRAGTYRWVSKYGVVTGLLKWRNDRRSMGQKAYQEMQQQLWTPQLEITFEEVQPPKNLMPFRSQTILCDLQGNSIHASAETVANYFSDVFASLHKGMEEDKRRDFEAALIQSIEGQWREINTKHMSSWEEDIPPVKITCWPRPGFLISEALEKAGATRLRGRKIGFIALNVHPWRIESLTEGI